MAFNSIELCAGVGMLGEGVRAAFAHLGIEHRTVCYVEREAPAASQLVTLMEAGALDPAPVWSDMLTFDGAAWRDCVDLVIAGFPCQDLSIAGRRAGLDGKRSGLFFRVLDIADACGARGLVLENVAGIATATASVVDEAEGALEERAAARVLGELADRGWHAEWITLSAADVGASHGRARWFCFAWRLADPGHGPRTHQPFELEGRGGPPHDCPGGQAMGDANLARWPAPGRGSEVDPGRQLEPRLGLVDDAECVQLAGQRIHPRSRHAGPGAPDADGAGSDMADAQGDRWHQGRTESGGQQGGSDAAERGRAVAHTGQPGLPHAEQSGEPGTPRPFGRRATPELRGALLFAPGPFDPRWSAIVTNRPDLAPAVEPGVRMLADGMAYLVDESRTHQLRQVGNGVVPLQAAAALVQLLRRAGFA